MPCFSHPRLLFEGEIVTAPASGRVSLLAQLGKESTCNAGELGSIPGLGKSPGEGNGYLLQYSGLENSVDWIVHGVTKSRKRLSDFSLSASGDRQLSRQIKSKVELTHQKSIQ